MRCWSVGSLALSCILLLACQGDRSGSSEPTGPLNLAGSACKSPDFVTAVGIYTSATQRRDLEDRCKSALQAKNKGNHVKAGTIIYGILAKLSADRDVSGLLQALSGKTLAESLVFFIDATCSLDPLISTPCEAPEPEEIDGWGAWGPVTSGSQAINPEASFAWRCDDCNGIYITISSRPLGTVLGPCPGSSDSNEIDNFPHDCQNDVYDFHAFIPTGASLNEWTAESCQIPSIGERHMRCPNGQCIFGEPGTVIAGLLLDCTGGVSDLGGWRGFVYQATRPLQWFLHATPAFAVGGLATTFDGGSPIVLGDLDPRRRGVVCNVETTFNSGSEGVTCQLRDGATVVASCVTQAIDNNSATCTMTPIVPDEGIVLRPRAFKTFGNGTYNEIQDPITLEPDDPPFGSSYVLPTFNLVPPGQS